MKSKLRLYLSGPITGHSSHQIRDWRREVEISLSDIASVVDPARYPLDAELRYKKPSARGEGRLRHGVHVVSRNENLIKNCDLVLANLIGTGDHASIGTVGEIFVAHMLRKPILIVREASGNVHDHAMINAVASVICTNLDQAVAAVREWAGQPLVSATPQSAKAATRALAS